MLRVEQRLHPEAEAEAEAKIPAAAVKIFVQETTRETNQITSLARNQFHTQKKKKEKIFPSLKYCHWLDWLQVCNFPFWDE